MGFRRRRRIFMLGAMIFLGALASAPPINAQLPPSPDPEETWESYVRNTTGIDAKLAHPIVAVEIAPGRSVVALTEQPKGHPVHWFVFVPTRERANSYNRFWLPASESRHGFVRIRAIFSANADRDSAEELLILCEQMTGIGPEGAKPWYETYVYDWTGKTFVLLEQMRKHLVNKSTAAQVRAALRH